MLSGMGKEGRAVAEGKRRTDTPLFPSTPFDKKSPLPVVHWKEAV